MVYIDKKDKTESKIEIITLFKKGYVNGYIQKSTYFGASTCLL